MRKQYVFKLIPYKGRFSPIILYMFHNNWIIETNRFKYTMNNFLDAMDMRRALKAR